jgi:predicted nuclease with TOPRIM domain
VQQSFTLNQTDIVNNYYGTKILQEQHELKKENKRLRKELKKCHSKMSKMESDASAWNNLIDTIETLSQIVDSTATRVIERENFELLTNDDLLPLLVSLDDIVEQLLWNAQEWNDNDWLVSPVIVEAVPPIIVESNDIKKPIKKRGRRSHTLQELLRNYHRTKTITPSLRDKLLEFIDELFNKHDLVTIFYLCSRLRDGQERIVQFIHEITSKLNASVKKRVLEMQVLDSIASVSEVLEQKDRLVIGDKPFNTLHINLTLSTPGISLVCIHRKGFNDRCHRIFQIEQTEHGFKACVKRIVEFIVQRAEISNNVPKKGYFVFKLSMDGRPAYSGQVGVMLQCLNCELFGKQDPRSVIYAALWTGKEDIEQVKKNCAGMRESINHLRTHGISIGTRNGFFHSDQGIIDHYGIKFVWVNDWKSWKTMVSLDHGEFCPYCHLKIGDNIFGKCADARTSIVHFFDCQPDETGLCNLHAIQRLTKGQIAQLFHSKQSVSNSEIWTPEYFKQVISKYIPNFKLVQKSEDQYYEKYVVFSF